MSLVVTNGLTTMITSKRGEWERKRERMRGSLSRLNKSLSRLLVEIERDRAEGLPVRELLEKEDTLRRREWRLTNELELLDFALRASEPVVAGQESAGAWYPTDGEPF